MKYMEYGKVYIVLILHIFMQIRYNPFNPQQPAKPHFFVGREQEVKCFENFLGQTIYNSPMNMTITGDRGMGKTSILNKFEEIADNQRALVVNVSNYEGNVKDVIELSEFLITNIQREIISRNPISKNVKEMYTSIVILIDEAESLENMDGLTFLREVFQKVQSNSNYMIVLAGKFNFPEKMSEQFSPLNRFFPAERLRRLTEKDVSNYLENRLNDTEVNIDKEAIYNLFKKSEGHPYVLVCIGFLVFDSLKTNEMAINSDVVERSIWKIRGKLSQDFFTPMFYPLSPQAKRIICKIAKEIKGLKFTMNEATLITNMPNNQLSGYFGEFL